MQLREFHVTYRKKFQQYEFSRRDCPTYLRGEEFKFTSLAEIFRQASKYDYTPLLETCLCTDESVRPLLHLAWCETFGINSSAVKPLVSTEATKEIIHTEIRKMLMDLLMSGGDAVDAWNSRFHGEKIDAKLDFTKLNLSGKVLNGIDLKNLDWSSCNFDNCELKGAELSNGWCVKASFKNSDLRGVQLSWTDANRADFSGANMQEAWSYKGIFKNTIFKKADLSNCNFDECDIRGADFTDSTINGASFNASKYDEKTKFPPDFPLEGLVWKGSGVDPRDEERLKDMLSEGAKDFSDFMRIAKRNLDSDRVSKAMKMLRKERFFLFSKITGDQVVGVVQSQTDGELVYSCVLTAEGKFSCCTQNLKACGGLKGALCKHLLVLIIGLTMTEQLTPEQAVTWCISSKFHQPKIDKELITATFLEYKGAQSGEIDWRPTETIPEDYYI